jgi:4-amino-4-deoxy-L-arabinose transferase-like glycosyltransferase
MLRKLGIAQSCVLVTVVLFTTGVRWRLLDVPLERDEGEYAYAGQLLLQGVVPYEHLYSMKLPGTYAAYALSMATFGQTRAGIHLGLLVVNLGTVLLIFGLGRALRDSATGAVAAAIFGVLSTSDSVLGFFAHAEHFVVALATAGMLLLFLAVEHDRRGLVLVSGITVGLGILMKQHGAMFAAAGSVYLLLAHVRRGPPRWRRIAISQALFALGVLVPLALTCSVIYLVGAFDKFRFWTLSYPWTYVSQVPQEHVWPLFWHQLGRVAGPALPLWLLAAAGLPFGLSDHRLRGRRTFLIIFVAFSALAVVPGFYFRRHDFLFVLPAVALLGALGVACVADRARAGGRRLLTGAVAVVTAACLAIPVFWQREYLFRLTPEQAVRTTYAAAPFAETWHTGDFLRRHTIAGDRIAVLEQAEPAFVVLVNVETSWLPRPGSSRLVFDWFRQYQRQFELAGLAEYGPRGARYRWTPDVLGPPTEERWIAVYRRKGRAAG